MKAMLKGLATFAFWAATLAFLTGVSLFLLGSFIATWPIMRKSPRNRRIKASMDLAAAAMTALTAFQVVPEPPDGDD